MVTAGYTGKVVRIDLSNQTVEIEEHDDLFFRRYVGGRGVIAYHLLRELGPGIDPLSPQNKLIFALGLLTGYPIAGSARNSVGAKSPLTNAYGEAEAGGYWGSELKRAGWNGLIIEGRSPCPVYLWMHDDQIEFRDARHLWGKLTADCQKTIQAELGDDRIRIAQIGPGGESMVRYASIVNDLHHFYGRTGMGAVMGSKNLKAIAVRGKSGQLSMADPERVRGVTKWLAEVYPEVCKDFCELGTGAPMEGASYVGGLPTRNFETGTFDQVSKITAQAVRDQIRIDMQGCYACPIKCKKIVQSDDPYAISAEYGGPEYETLASFGSNCGIGDLKAIAKANELCNAYTVDTMSAGVVIGFVMECFERGLIGREQTDGLELRFGRSDVMLEMVGKICRREGFGRLLGEGIVSVAKHIGQGCEAFALHVKGLEYPMHDPRFKQGMGLGYATAPTGADHCVSVHDALYTMQNRSFEMLKTMGILEPLPVGDLSPAKVRMVTYQGLWRSLNNSIGMCVLLPYSPSQLVELVGGVAGWNTSMWELAKVAERTINMTRLFNVREGFGRVDDALAPRSYEPFEAGPLKGVKVDKENLEEALTLYYEMMGWEPETGVPTKGKLHELDLGWALDALRDYL